jgi:predicted transcriptional regulator
MKLQRLAEIEQACQPWQQKVIHLRPYWEPKPFTCFKKDSFQKTLSIFRLMNCRQLPVLDEKRNCALVGIITRQDLFKYMVS